MFKDVQDKELQDNPSEAFVENFGLDTTENRPPTVPPPLGGQINVYASISASKKAFGDLQLGHEKAFGTIANGVFFGTCGIAPSSHL